MHDDEERMLLLGLSHQQTADKRASCEIERLLRGCFETVAHPLIAFRFRELGEIHQGQLDSLGWLDQLYGSAVHRGKTGPEDFMTVHDVLHGALEGVDVQGPDQTQRSGDM